LEITNGQISQNSCVTNLTQTIYAGISSQVIKGCSCCNVVADTNLLPTVNNDISYQSNANPLPSYGIAITGTDLGTSPAAACSATPGVERFTTTGEIATGLILYLDSELTIPQTEFTYVANDNDGEIFNLNPVTGLIGIRTPFTC
jgi:hypothetical protein